MSVLQVAAQEPAVAEVVVALDELDAIAALEAQFVGTARGEFVWAAQQISAGARSAARRCSQPVARPAHGGNSRMTRRVSPGRAWSMSGRAAMACCRSGCGGAGGWVAAEFGGRRGVGWDHHMAALAKGIAQRLAECWSVPVRWRIASSWGGSGGLGSRYGEAQFRGPV